MKRFFSIMSIVFLMITFVYSYAYEIANSESIQPSANVDTSNYTFYKSSDAGSTQKYVRSYSVGGSTALQVCSHGSENSGATHTQNVTGMISVDFNKSEIISVTPPTCLENGSMRIRCKNMVEEGLIFKTERECGEEATIILEKIGHTVNNHSLDSKCQNCGEVHSKKSLLTSSSDDNNHYYSCSFEGCTEEIAEEHTFSKDNSGKWICSGCNFEQSGHEPSGEWVVDNSNENMHYEKCAFDGCDEKFNLGEHLGGTHPEGICSRCNAHYQTHAMDESAYETNGNNHWYKCTFNGCNKKFNEEAHSGGTHPDGICVTCKINFQTHFVDESVFENDEDNHWNNCSYKDCNEKFNLTGHNLKNAEGGKLECECGYFIQVEHYAVEVWSGDEKIHYKKCIVEGCNEVFESSNHTGGTHEGDASNGIKAGECTVCHLIYQSHLKDTSKFDSDDEYHWYGCKIDGCDGVFKEAHKKGTKVYYDETHHWYICSNSDCKKEFGREEHYGGEENNGICKGCKMDYMNELTSLKIKKGSKGEDGYRELEELGDNVTLQVEFTPKKTVFTNVTWSSQDENIATVDENGVVTGLSDGITVIYVRHGNLEDSCQIFVGDAVFKIIAEKTEMNEDDTCELSTNLEDNSIEIEWSINNEDLGEIETESNGTAIFTSASDVGGKTVTISAKLKNGIEDKVKIKIVHSGGTHENGGECQVCGEVYETHKLSNFKYVDETGHYKTCSNSKCSGKKFEEAPHTSSNECTDCGWKKSNSGNSGGSGSNSGNSGGSGNTGTNKEDEWEWKYDSRFHWKNYKYSFKNGPKESHTASYFTGAGGKCEICGAVNSGVCVHNDWTENYKHLDAEKHNVLCAGCGIVKKTEEHMFDSNDVCRRCDLPKGGDKVETREWVFYIATKEYYVEEGETTYIPITEIVNKQDLKNFTWKTDTTGDKEFDSLKNETSNDGTIIFGYSDEQFYAKLTESEIEKLSTEVTVTIKAHNIHGNTFTQRIKLIKNGAPRSSCKIYLTKTKFSLDDTQMQIKVKTSYEDFNDRDVKSYGKETMPWYEIVENSLNIKSNDTSILEITGQPEIAELSEENGYYITVPISVKKVGAVSITASLTTEYTYKSHKTLQKNRTYTDVISVTNKKISDNSNSGGQSSGNGGNTGNSSGGSSGGGSGVLAAVGAGALLLILAVIGASKNSRR